MVMSIALTLVAARDRRFSIPDRSGHLFRHARRHPRRRASWLAPVGAGRHADQFGEASAEGAQRRAANRETDLGDAEVATTQQRHRALDPPRHQVAVRRLAVGEPELAAEVPGRHVRAAGERLDVERLRILPIDPVANATQPRKITQVLRLGRCARHARRLAQRARAAAIGTLMRSSNRCAAGYSVARTARPSAMTSSPGPGRTSKTTPTISSRTPTKVTTG